ncbi:MAG: RIP metalloprotease RseP [Patescibacteria group bacterium]|nr:RIP metalloprotease RseP [Patescibacteria group bacterium]
MLLTILVFIVILGIIVLVHEAGHFFVARATGTKIEEFGLGFPPRLVGFYKNSEGKRKIIWGSKFKAETAPSTVYSLNRLPIGGFVKIKGEDGVGENDKDSFVNKRSWQKAAILTAGVLGNFLLCVILFSVGFGIGLPTAIEDGVLHNAKNVRDNQIQIISVNSDSPAEIAGLKVGDAILTLDDKTMAEIKQIQDYTAEKNGLLVEIKVKRGENILTIQVVPKILETSDGHAVLGVGLMRTAVVSYAWYEAIWQGIKNTGIMIWAILLALFDVIRNIFTKGEVSADLSGPIGIAVMTGQVMELGWIYMLQFTALLSLNLGIINILPFPALDGGRLLFVAIEKIRGKKNNQKVEGLVHNIGFAVLMLLVVLVTYRDLARWGGQIIHKIF